MFIRLESNFKVLSLVYISTSFLDEVSYLTIP
jgi:hypothetical protein